jgi:hypothetical protein
MNRGAKIALVVLGLLTLGVGGYYAYFHYTNNSGSTASAKKNRKLVYTRN